MPQSLTLQTLQDVGHDHLTEDALYTGVFEQHVIMAVADGAPLRLRPVPSMTPLLERFAPRYGAGITPSGISARLTRDTVAELAAADPTCSLVECVMTANARVAEALCAVYGDISAEQLLRHEPQFTILEEDERYRRLMLPACTFTIARIALAERSIEVVHGADSLLLLFMADGSVEQVTPDQMKQHDDAFKRLWLETGDAPAEHPFFRALGDNRALELNRMNGLYHNYVGKNGEIDPAVGVAVINGLPEVAHYLFTTRRSLDGVQAALVASDGLIYPQSPLEDAAPDWRTLRLLTEREGLAGYLRALRAEETRLRETGINPYQGHDDVSAVLVTWDL